MNDADQRVRDRLLAEAQEARRDLTTAHRTIEELRAEVARRNDRQQELTERQRILEERSAAWRERATSAEYQLESNQHALESAQTELASLRDELADAWNRAARAQVERDQLRTELAASTGSIDARRRELEAELAKAKKNTAKYQDRLQAQYDLKWTRIGALLRDVRRRPVRVVKLPVRLAREVRGVSAPSTARAKQSKPTTSATKKPARKQVKPSVDPRFDKVTARDPRPVLSILDPFTEACLAPELRIERAERQRFETQLAGTTLVFAESAWRGNAATWSYQFNRFKTGNDVDILTDLAREAGIPTAIWNKEDPVNYDLFLPVMRQFDYVFTSDADIVDRYRADLGHDRVGPMIFAAQPLLHNPIGRDTGATSSICFAGAWRGGKYPGRAERLGTLLDAAVASGELVIFDREPTQNDEEHGFPERFHPFIKGTLDYRQMVDEYRRHACFINVNTVEQSSTMMSRRVFEILACRTPVVSTPSAAIDAQLADIVLTPSGASETAQVLTRLASDIDHRDRLGQLGYRAVMSEHTYQHRIADAFELMGRSGFERPHQPSIDVICVSSRPAYLRHALDNYRRQTYPNTRLVFVTNSSQFDQAAVESALHEFDNAAALHLPEHLTLGECLNAAIDMTDGEFFAKFDDDDHYGAEYLSDLVLATRYADATVYGKRSFHAYVEGADRTVVRHEGHEFEYTNLVMGGTLLVRRADVGSIRFEAVPAGTDTRFLKACSAAGHRIFSTDRFNYLMVRRATTEHHTWKISDDEFLSTSRELAAGLALDDVLI